MNRRRWRQAVVAGRRTVATGYRTSSSAAERRPRTTNRRQGIQAVAMGGRASSPDDEPSPVAADCRPWTTDRRYGTTGRRHQRQTVVPRRRTVAAGYRPSSPDDEPSPRAAERRPWTMNRRRWRQTVVAGRQTVATRYRTSSSAAERRPSPTEHRPRTSGSSARTIRAPPLPLAGLKKAAARRRPAATDDEPPTAAFLRRVGTPRLDWHLLSVPARELPARPAVRSRIGTGRGGRPQTLIVLADLRLRLVEVCSVGRFQAKTR